MFTDKQFDNYNEAIRSIRNYKNDAFENVIKAFNLALLKKTPTILKNRFLSSGRGAWYSVTAIIWEGVTYVLKIQASAVIIFGLIGAAIGSGVPIAGTSLGGAIGVRVGVTVASWYLAVIGIGSIAAITGQIAGTVSVYFEEGIKKAQKGEIEAGSKDIAQGIAKVLEMVAACIILLCFIKGGQKVLGKIKTKFSTNSKLLSELKNLPTPINNMQMYFKSSRWGYFYEELKSLKAMSQGGKLYVIRTCNPGCVKVSKQYGVPLQAKGTEIQGKSIKSGLFNGQVGVTLSDMQKLKKNYWLEPIPLNAKLRRLPTAAQAKHRLPNAKQNTGYRLKKKPGANGELDNHIIEQTTFINARSDATKWRLLDPKGNPHIPDMDRAICMEIDIATLNGRHLKLKDTARFGDDPLEIDSFVREFNSRIKHKVSPQVVKHGYTSSNVNSRGEPIWHATENETLLAFIDGKVFEMSWNELVLFCEANKALNLPQCFRALAASH